MLPDRPEVILFDLDGTLVDSSPGIATAFRAALSEVGHEHEGLDLRSVIGPPLTSAFAALGVHEDRIEAAVAAYRAVYRESAMYQAPVFPGIPDLLARLVGEGRRLAVATSKPWVFAEPILDHHDLRDCFVVVGGAELDGSRSTKAQVVAHTLERLGSPDPARVVMVGDRIHDVQGAAAHGVATIGVTWGFAAPGELDPAAARVVGIDELDRALGRAGPRSVRRAVRALTVDSRGRVLLVHWVPGHIDLWLAPGGGVEAGESPRQALARELGEELGVSEVEIGRPVFTRQIRFEPGQGGGFTHQREIWFLVELEGFDPATVAGLTGSEQEAIVEARWWTAEELKASTERLAPARLGWLIEGLLSDPGPPEELDAGL